MTLLLQTRTSFASVGSFPVSLVRYEESPSGCDNIRTTAY